MTGKSNDFEHAGNPNTEGVEAASLSVVQPILAQLDELIWDAKTSGITPTYLKEVRAKVGELGREHARLLAIINTPQSDNFLRAVSTEAEHQRQRWGSEHDAGKTPADWFWLVGYLAGKGLHAQAAGDLGKVEHHLITTAAALANWHLATFGKCDSSVELTGSEQGR